MLPAGIDITKLLSNSHGLTKTIWLPLEVVMLLNSVNQEVCRDRPQNQIFSIRTMQGCYGENKKEIRK